MAAATATGAACPSLGDGFELLNPFAWDPAAASTLCDSVDPASISAATAVSGADGHSSFSSLDLDLDLAHCLNAFVSPVFDFGAPSTSPPPAAPLGSTTASLSSTPVTANSQSPSPPPHSPDDGGTALIPGLKLPRAKTRTLPGRPGRRPAAAPLSQTAGGRITKHGSHGASPAASSVVATAVASAAAPEDVDPEILDRRYRNNLAAKRYRQKKIDRIEQLEKEVSDLKQERDELRIRLVRQEAEVAALREMLKMTNGEKSND
ncbi:hypothetical protein VTH06DRAFT_4902 [Thermothelomyces fergusii]